MTDEVHPLVTLLVARAKSHPEEFRGGRPNALNPANRWWFAVDTIRRDGTAEDKALLASTIGRVLMDEAHEWALDELMNGEQRRAGEEEKRHLAMQQAVQAQSVPNAYKGTLGLWGVNQTQPTVSADLKAQNLYEQLKQANVMGVKK